MPDLLELAGTPITFPYKTYPVQKEYMSSVITALNNSTNALLESPTGTGKTLSLLCSTLAWQSEQKKKKKVGGYSNSSSSSSDPTPATHPSSTLTSDVRLTDNVYEHTNSDKRTNRTRAPTIVYASRTHSQLTQVVNELKRTIYTPKYAMLGAREHFCVHEKVSKLAPSSISQECSKVRRRAGAEQN